MVLFAFLSVRYAVLLFLRHLCSFSLADFDEDENIEFTIEGDVEVRSFSEICMYAPRIPRRTWDIP